MTTATLPQYDAHTCMRCITVYCWSRTTPGTAQWAEAERLGRLAVEGGFSIVTGGYCGSMEAVSKGAREARDAMTHAPRDDNNNSNNDDDDDGDAAACRPEVVGVLVSGIFPDRALVGNRYLTQQRDSTSMLHRIEQLTSLSRYYVILPGTLGTLQELCCIWVQKLLHPRDRAAPVILAYREPWERCLRGIAACLQLPDEQLALVQFVDDADEVMRHIRADYAQMQQQQQQQIEAAS